MDSEQGYALGDHRDRPLGPGVSANGRRRRLDGPGCRRGRPLPPFLSASCIVSMLPSSPKDSIHPTGKAGSLNLAKADNSNLQSQKGWPGLLPGGSLGIPGIPPAPECTGGAAGLIPGPILSCFPPGDRTVALRLDLRQDPSVNEDEQQWRTSGRKRTPQRSLGRAFRRSIAALSPSDAAFVNHFMASPWSGATPIPF